MPYTGPRTSTIGTRSCCWTACQTKRVCCSACAYVDDLCFSPLNLRAGSVAGSVAEKWRVDTTRHIIRRADYKGKQKQALHLPFDGLTMPALLFVASGQQ